MNILYAYFLLVLFEDTSAVYKRWLPDTNFENPNNWNAKRAPCGNDVVIIQDDSPVVYVQMNTTIQKLTLPMNSELILGLNVEIGFTQNAVPGCKDFGGDLLFDAVHPVPWLNPTSWCTAPTERGQCDTTKFVLDVEKIPCSYDDVVFPQDHSYYVDLSEDTPVLSAKSVKISGDTFNTTTFSNFTRSAEGRRMFHVSSAGGSRDRVNITRRSCADARGCPCGNDIPGISSAICRHVEGSCLRPRCNSAVQPVGSCCKICGAMFNITRGYGFNFQNFVSALKNKYFTTGEYSDVNITTSVTSEGWVQTVLTDVTGNRSVALAQLMLSDFTADVRSGGHKYAIDKVPLLLSSGSPTTSSPIEPTHSPITGGATGAAMTAGSVAAIVVGIIAVIVITVLVVVLFIFRRNGRGFPKLPYMPRRTPRATALVLPEVSSQPRTAPHIDPGFANPLYDTSPFDDGNFVIKEMELIQASAEQQPTFDVSDRGFYNPLFGTSGASVFSDPAKSEEQQASGSKSIATASSSKTVVTGIKIDNPSSVNGDSTI